MSTSFGPMICRAFTLLVLSLIGQSAMAQDGVPFQLNEVQEQLVQIGYDIGKLEATASEVVLAERSRCDRPVNWNRKLPGNERFAVALNGHAFCDLETGLVWMETPLPDTYHWRIAKDACRWLQVDGRFGWHLPTIEQLLSLVDRQSSYPALPIGHPFKGVVSGVYLTSTPQADSVYYRSRQVWKVDLGTGQPFFQGVLDPPFPKSDLAWCVRGGAVPPPIADINLYGSEIEP